MTDELVRDEVPVSQEHRYKVNIYFRVLDSMHAGEIRCGATDCNTFAKFSDFFIRTTSAIRLHM
jgi:hypothetical protein